ncbi:MAG: hypothetical protein FWF81_04025 [Defluviitaleaceae bacterium]|nr:hypothetical protein [Defluviitaleaceae bacterium]
MKNFNWALLIGCVIIALFVSFAIRSAADTISRHMPNSLHGNFHGSLTSHAQSEPREFMSLWEAANFISMNSDEFTRVLESGELSGTYTTFQVERLVWTRNYHPFMSEDGTFSFDYSRPVPVEPVRAGNMSIQMIGPGDTYEIVIEDHRVFSREKLTDWLNNRIQN